MTTEVALGTPRPAEVTMALAKALAGAGMLPYALRNKPSDVLLVMLTGRDLGIPPTFALNLIYVVDGHPTLSAKLQLALLRRSGHKVEEIECSPERVTLRGTHAVTGDVVTATYTYAEAEKATYTSWEGGEGEKRRKVTKKLVEKDNWQYREDMLYARCSSRLSRRLDPMATGGLYAPEDFGASDPEPVTVTVEAVEPHPDTLSRVLEAQENDRVPTATPQESKQIALEIEAEEKSAAAKDALPEDPEIRTTYLREEVRRMLRDIPQARKPTKKEMEAAGDPEAVHALVLAAYEASRAEEDAALRGEPGELPLKPGDEAPALLVGCPRCGEKVPTGELAEHLGIEHEGVGS